MIEQQQAVRIKLSQKGIDEKIVRFPEKAQGWMFPDSRKGRPVYPGCVRVKWDHCKNRETIHESFIEVTE